MSDMSKYYYVEPISPSIHITNESHKIFNNKIKLDYLPDQVNGVLISGYTEQRFNKTITSATQFVVDYNLGIITFDSSKEGTAISNINYYGKGLIKIYADRISLVDSNNLYNSDNIEDFAIEVIEKINNHTLGISQKHNSEDIIFNSIRPTINADDVKEAIEEIDQRIDNIVNDPNPNKDIELIDFRNSSIYGVFSTAKERGDNTDITLSKHLIESVNKQDNVENIKRLINSTQNPEVADIYIATNGSDSNDGKIDTPVLTLQRAIEIASELLNSQNVLIYMRNGDYNLSQTIVINNVQKNHKLKIEAYPQEAVSILGNVQYITEFTPVTINGVNGVVADLPLGVDETKVKSVFDIYRYKHITLCKHYDTINNKAFRSPGIDSSNGVLSIRIPSSITLPANMDDVEIVIFNQWTNHYRTTNGVSDGLNGEKLLHLSTTNAIYPFDMSNIAFYLMNHKDFVTEEDEWYIEKSTRKLYWIKPSEITNLTLAISSLNKFLEIKNSSNIEFKNIHFKYLDYDMLTMQNDSFYAQSASNCGGAVEITDGSSNIHFYDCSIRFFPYYGLKIKNNSNNNSFNNGEISNSCVGGVFIDDGCNNNIVFGNEIYNLGLILKQGCGVLIKGSEDIAKCDGNEVIGNKIHDLVYSGISIGWYWSHYESQDNTKFTAPNTKISNNVIYNIGRTLNTINPDYNVLADGGGIYVLGNVAGSEIFDNIIAFLYSPYTYFNGIYLDSGTSNLTIKRNLVFAVSHYAYAARGINGMHNNIVENNTFIAPCEVLLTQSGDVYVPNGDSGSTFKNNIVIGIKNEYVESYIASKATPYSLRAIYTENQQLKFNNNIYINPVYNDCLHKNITNSEIGSIFKTISYLDANSPLDKIAFKNYTEHISEFGG